MKHKLKLKRVVPLPELEDMLRKTIFRGLYDAHGEHMKPYARAKFTPATIYPPKGIGFPAEIQIGKRREYLFTPQPTIYENQVEIIQTVDRFLRSKDMKITHLKGAVEYSWEGRGDFHVLPPIIEKHTYRLERGFFDLEHMARRFAGTYARDASGNLHNLGTTELHNFYIDEVSKHAHLSTFNSNAPIMNYGLQYTGDHTFYIICDGTHRIDYALEVLGKPIKALVVEPKQRDVPLIPYYAFPVPLRPTVRLSSKRAEKMFHRLERDKIHLLNDFIRKILHYDWEAGGLSVSKLRSNVEIY